MPKTRLNQTHRDILRSFADQAIKCPKEQKAWDKAFERAANAVKAAAEKAFPPAEMAILNKYNALAEKGRINLVSPEGKFLSFEYGTDDRRPSIPRKGSYDMMPVPLPAAAVTIVEEFDLAANALKNARAAKFADYKALISTAVYFEDVLDVWPAAEAVGDRVKRQQTSLVVLSADKIAAIRSDNAGADLVKKAA